MASLVELRGALSEVFEGRYEALTESLGELTLVVRSSDYQEVARVLRDHPALRFDTAVDVCGIDYLEYGASERLVGRFAVVVHLLSVELNRRLRLRVFCPDDSFPVVPSLIDIWPAVGWFEREAFDLFGIVFEGHPDLRRILTDYGFVGHPFRKDFPVSGFVEMRYDPEEKRVVYQPVTIEPREIVPRIIREEGYGVGR